MAQRLPVYQAIAARVTAWHNCQKPEANESQRSWTPEHKRSADTICRNHMPSGSGIDNGTQIVWEQSSRERLVFKSALHKMDENGYYDGWLDFTVTVTPSLLYGIELRFVGIQGRDKFNHLDYLRDRFDCALREVIDC